MTTMELDIRDKELAAAKQKAVYAEQIAAQAKKEAEEAERKRNQMVSRAVSVRSYQASTMLVAVAKQSKRFSIFK